MTDQIHIFVINLDKDTQRLNHITLQLSREGLVFERMRGVVGGDLKPSEIETHYCESMAKWRQSRPLSVSEIGCSLSHLKIYREILRRNLPLALVLEDDVVLPPDFKHILTILEQNVDRKSAAVLLLSEAQTRHNPVLHLAPGLSISRFLNGYYSSSYILTAAAAQSLLDELYPVSLPADAWNRLSRKCIVDINVVTPAIVRQDQETFGSSTTEEIRKLLSGSPWSSALYLVRRSRAVLLDAIAPFFLARRSLMHRPEPHPIDTLFD